MLLEELWLLDFSFAIQGSAEGEGEGSAHFAAELIAGGELGLDSDVGVFLFLPVLPLLALRSGLGAVVSAEGAEEERVVTGLVESAGLFGCLEGGVVEEVEGPHLPFGEEGAQSAFEDDEALEEVEDVELLGHLLAALVEELGRLPAAAALEEVDHDVAELQEEVDEVVLLESLPHVVVVGLEEVLAHQDLEGVAVVEVDQEEADGYRPK